MSLDKIAVIGAGIMGHGIAQVCAQGGKQVTLVDVSPQVLENARQKIREGLRLLVDNGLAAAGDEVAALGRISFSADLAAGVKDADIVIEAIPEKIQLKKKLFAQLEAACGPKTIFASNTSGIPINKLAALTRRPDRVIGAHFYMPAHLVPLVEVIQGDATAEDVIVRTMELLTEIGKRPVRVRKDVPGFIGNRLQHALAREAMSLVEKGVATAEDIDTVVKTSLAIRLVFTGPLEQRDFNGLDTHMSIAEYLYPDLEDAKSPLAILRDKVTAGSLGLKTGEGFYDWRGQSAPAVINTKNQQLIDLLKFLASSQNNKDKGAI